MLGVVGMAMSFFVKNVRCCWCGIATSFLLTFSRQKHM